MVDMVVSWLGFIKSVIDSNDLLLDTEMCSLIEIAQMSTSLRGT